MRFQKRMSNNIEFKKINKFIASHHSQIEKYRNDKENRNKTERNIFSSISDAYKNENYNSDIIRFILDPNKDGMGCEKYLEEFFDFIGIDEKNIRNFFANKNKIEVTREEKRIDVLIKNTDTKEAVIIESKINDACDQPMQLVRYYKNLTDSKYKVLKIVYLTVYQKSPDFKYNGGYGISEEEYEDLLKEIKPLLFKTFISQEKPTKEYHKFQDCLSRFKDSDIITQYEKLICSLGGGLYMNEEEFVQEAFNNMEELEDIKSLVDIYNNFGNALYKIFYEREFVKGSKWEKKENIFYKSLDDTELELYFCAVYSKRYGFWTEVGFNAKETKDGKKCFEHSLEKMKSIIQNLAVENEININDGIHGKYEQYPWCCLQYAYNATETLDAYFDKVKKIIARIQEEAEKSLIERKSGYKRQNKS